MGPGVVATSSPCCSTLPPTNDKPTVTVVHGGSLLGAITVDAYNAELRDDEGFIGDRASNRAFRAIIEESRERLRDVSGIPSGRRRPRS